MSKSERYLFFACRAAGASGVKPSVLILLLVQTTQLQHNLPCYKTQENKSKINLCPFCLFFFFFAEEKDEKQTHKRQEGYILIVCVVSVVVVTVSAVFLWINRHDIAAFFTTKTVKLHISYLDNN